MEDLNGYDNYPDEDADEAPEEAQLSDFVASGGDLGQLMDLHFDGYKAELDAAKEAFGE